MGVPTGGFLESAYKVLMRRNSVYVAFVITGALVGERVRTVLFLTCPRRVEKRNHKLRF